MKAIANVDAALLAFDVGMASLGEAHARLTETLDQLKTAAGIPDIEATVHGQVVRVDQLALRRDLRSTAESGDRSTPEVDLAAALAG